MAPSFTLSSEEVLVLINVLRLDGLIGFDPEPFTQLQEQELALLLSTAERALQARGYLQPAEEERQVVVDPVVVALVGGCGIADVSLAAMYANRDGESEIRYFHVHRATNTFIERTFPMPYLHTFQALDDEQTLISRIADVLRVGDQPAPSCPPGRVQTSTFEKCQERLKEDAAPERVEEATQLLLQDGLPEPTASALAATLAAPVANGLAFQVDREGNYVNGFVTLEGSDGLWWLVPPRENERWIHVEPLKGQGVPARIEKFVKDTLVVEQPT